MEKEKQKTETAKEKKRRREIGRETGTARKKKSLRKREREKVKQKRDPRAVSKENAKRRVSKRGNERQREKHERGVNGEKLRTLFARKIIYEKRKRDEQKGRKEENDCEKGRIMEKTREESAQRRSQEKMERRRACVDKGREERTELRRGHGGRKRSKLAVKAAPRVASLLPLGQALSSWQLLDDRYAVTHAAHEIPADQETADRMLAETITALRARERRNSTVVASGRFLDVSATGNDDRY